MGLLLTGTRSPGGYAGQRERFSAGPVSRRFLINDRDETPEEGYPERRRFGASGVRVASPALPRIGVQ